MYEIDLQSIRFSNGKRYRFPAEIAETLDFEESIIVRLASDHLGTGQNIYGRLARQSLVEDAVTQIL